MQQRPEKFNPALGDPEATLVAPRFDAEEARRAHPVVPLAEAQAHAPQGGAYAPRGLRRSWPTALMVVALFAVAALGGAVASMFMRGTPSAAPAAQAPTVAAPAQAAEVPAQVEPPPAPAVAPREVADTTAREVSDTAPPEVADAKPEARAPRDTQARRDEAAPVRARDEGGRDDRKVFEDEDKRDRERERRRERRERREEKVEAAAEKEMRKALKRAHDKAPRLVDVIVNPGN